MEPTVIYKEKNFLAINKPAGLLVHPTHHGSWIMKHETGEEELATPQLSNSPSLTDWLVRHYPEVKLVGDSVKLPDGSYGTNSPNIRPGIVHRLDRETSGIMLVPRTQAYFEYLKGLFQKHEIEKTYLALVGGRVTESAGRIDRPIGLKSGTVKRTVHGGKMVKSAVTDFRVRELYMKEGSECTLLEVHPKTGRTHQIRVHLSSIGHPILGDSLYGPKQRPVWITRLMLHASEIEFVPEPGRRLKLSAPLPEEFLVLAKLFS